MRLILEMSVFLIDIFGLFFWQLFFVVGFFFGLFYFLLLIFGAVSHHDDVHHSDHTSKDILHHDTTVVDVSDHHNLDLHLSELDHHALSTSDIMEMNHINVDKTVFLDHEKDKFELRSVHKMGNISTFLFFFGICGNFFGENLNDQNILFACITGIIAMKLFSTIIANYSRTVFVPIKYIRRGDIGKVINGISPNKSGIVQIKRKDGVISTVIARGCFPHDYFEKSELGYIWGKSGEIYLLTRGIEGQPDLHNSNKIKGKQKHKDAFDPLLEE